MELTVSPAALVPCEECNQPVPVDRTIRHRTVYVCLNCKHAFMQKLAEGAQINTGELRWAGFWIRFAATFVDGLILIPVNFGVQLALGLTLDQSVGIGVSLLMLAASQLLNLLTSAIYEVLMVGRYGATVGKMACGLKVVMPDGSKPTYLRSLTRFLAKEVGVFTAFIGYVIAAFDKEKRALHDLMCNTRVIYKPVPAIPQDRCPQCHRRVLEPTQNGPLVCDTCATSFEVEVFPALFRQPEPVREPELILVEGESACFYHADKRALLPCHACGRFLCALCDCELNRDHFCPACIEAGATKGKMASLEKRRTKHDSIALSLATLPIITGYLPLVTAPAAIFIAIRHWNSPRSIVPRTRIRFVVAILLGLLEIFGWVVLIYIVVRFISARANL